MSFIDARALWCPSCLHYTNSLLFVGSYNLDNDKIDEIVKQADQDILQRLKEESHPLPAFPDMATYYSTELAKPETRLCSSMHLCPIEEAHTSVGFCITLWMN